MERNKRRVEGVQKNPQSRQRESSRDATLQKRAVIHKVIGLPGDGGGAVKVLRGDPTRLTYRKIRLTVERVVPFPVSRQNIAHSLCAANTPRHIAVCFVEVVLLFF